MSEGYVYILSNPSMPGLIKIGKTTGDPDARAAQLYVTGVPTPFVVECAVLTPDCGDLESRLHSNFSEERISPAREFFRCDISHAVSALEADLKIQIDDFVETYLPGRCVAHSATTMCDEDLELLALRSTACIATLGEVITTLKPEEIVPLIHKRGLPAEVRALEASQ